MPRSPHADNPETPAADVGIVGAGMAGAALATVLARRGLTVALFDTRPDCGPTFKAEKLEPDQLALLDRLGLLSTIGPVTRPIARVERARGTARLAPALVQQRGAPYQVMVNALRQALPNGVATIVDRVQGMEADADGVTIRSTNAGAYRVRLGVLAAGASPTLADRIGVRRQVVRTAHSVAVGFTIRSTGNAPFAWDALTIQPPRWGTAIDYLSLFAIPDGMRANLFAYLDPASDEIRAFLDSPADALARYFGHLETLIGPFTFTSRVEARPIDLWRAEPLASGGIVLAGDACQSVCPATGTGLTKVLTDVSVLGRCIPRWLETGTSSPSALAVYYNDPDKRAADAHSLATAEYLRRVATDRGWRMRVHRWRNRLRETMRRGTVS